MGRGGLGSPGWFRSCPVGWRLGRGGLGSPGVFGVARWVGEGRGSGVVSAGHVDVPSRGRTYATKGAG